MCVPTAESLFLSPYVVPGVYDRAIVEERLGQRQLAVCVHHTVAHVRQSPKQAEEFIIVGQPFLDTPGDEPDVLLWPVCPIVDPRDDSSNNIRGRWYEDKYIEFAHRSHITEAAL